MKKITLAKVREFRFDHLSTSFGAYPFRAICPDLTPAQYRFSAAPV